jgi:hypothetical protein
MNKNETTRTGHTRNIALLMVLGLAVLTFGLAGCQSSDTSSQVSGLTGAVDDGATFEPITLSEVRAKVALKSDQEALMASALERYNRAVESNRAARQQKRTEGERGPRGRLSAGERPLHVLLTESAEFLDADQMASLISAIKERRESMRAERRQQWAGRSEGYGRNFRGPGGPGEQMFADLNLTETQQEQLAELREQHRTAMQALRDRSSGSRGFGRSDDAAAMREQMRKESEAILTPDQLQQLEARREARRSERQQKMQEGASERHGERIELLTRVLKLNEAQVSDIESILATTHDKMQQSRESARGSHSDRKDRWEQGAQIRAETHNAIRNLLNDEQLKVFDAMTDLLPSGQHGHRRPL